MDGVTVSFIWCVSWALKGRVHLPHSIQTYCNAAKGKKEGSRMFKYTIQGHFKSSSSQTWYYTYFIKLRCLVNRSKGHFLRLYFSKHYSRWPTAVFVSLKWINPSSETFAAAAASTKECRLIPASINVTRRNVCPSCYKTFTRHKDLVSKCHHSYAHLYYCVTC